MVVERKKQENTNIEVSRVSKHRTYRMRNIYSRVQKFTCVDCWSDSVVSACITWIIDISQSLDDAYSFFVSRPSTRPSATGLFVRALY